MNARMLFGIFWIGLAWILSYMTGLSPGVRLILFGNFVMGVFILIWGMAAKHYAGKDDPAQEQESEKQS